MFQMTIPRHFLVLTIGFALVGQCHADEFHQSEWAPATSWEAAGPELEKTLLSEIESLLGHEQRQLTEGRLRDLQSSLAPLFKALPKNEYGKLGHSSVRYMLHRYFVEAHGWYVEGVHTEGEAWNVSSPAHMLKNRVPLLVQGLFEKRLGGCGFGLHEMAVLVATVENSVHDEATQRIQTVMQVLNMSLASDYTVTAVDELLQTFMVALIARTDLSMATADSLIADRSTIGYYYPTWPQAQKWLRTLRQNYTNNRTDLTYADVATVAMAISDKFGHYHGKHCGSLKAQLGALEEPGSSGCVRLPDFYIKGLAGGTYWLFIESPDYLRHIGVLEESDPRNPRVLTANYINNPSNCIHISSYYLVCCHNECDDILGNLERKIGAPTAGPLDIILALSKDEASAQKLPIAARRRLYEVARHHDGRVPLHGRLFAQWLHQAYPQECPYPHLSGTRSPEWMEDYESETQKTSSLNTDELIEFINNASTPAVQSSSAGVNTTKEPGAGSCVPWTHEEELLVALPPPPSHLRVAPAEDPHVWRFGSFVALLGALATAVLHLIRTFKSLLRERPACPLQKV